MAFPRLKLLEFVFCVFLIFLKFYFIIKLYKIVLVLPNIEMNPPQVYMCSPSWTLLPSPSPYHPSGSSQCTSPKHPVSCIKPGLATRFIHDSIHVSMPFSQIIPPSPSPTESIRLFYTSVSLLLSCTQGYCYHLSINLKLLVVFYILWEQRECLLGIFCSLSKWSHIAWKGTLKKIC